MKISLVGSSPIKTKQPPMMIMAPHNDSDDQLIKEPHKVEDDIK